MDKPKMAKGTSTKARLAPQAKLPARSRLLQARALMAEGGAKGAIALLEKGLQDHLGNHQLQQQLQRLRGLQTR